LTSIERASPLLRFSASPLLRFFASPLLRFSVDRERSSQTLAGAAPSSLLFSYRAKMSKKTDPFAISMVPLGPNPKISPSALKADLSSTWPDLPPLGPTEKSENKILTFDVGDMAHVFLTLMPGPIPWSDLEGPCATSVLWKDAEKVLKPHRAHVLVTILFDDKRSPLEKSKLLTQVTAA